MSGKTGLHTLDLNSILIHCATDTCNTNHHHHFSEGFPLDASLRHAKWQYATDKKWYCPTCSTPAATAVRPRNAA